MELRDDMHILRMNRLIISSMLQTRFASAWLLLSNSHSTPQ